MHYETTVPTVKDRVVQMVVKLVIEPLLEADFVPCSFGFRPEKTPRMALSIIAEKTQAGYGPGLGRLINSSGRDLRFFVGLSLPPEAFTLPRHAGQKAGGRPEGLPHED